MNVLLLTGCGAVTDWKVAKVRTSTDRLAEQSDCIQPKLLQIAVLKAAAVVVPPVWNSPVRMVRAYYQWPLIAPLMSQALETLNGGKNLITTTATFRNEPYGS